MSDEQKYSVDLTQEAIATNRDALLQIVAWLFTVLGLGEASTTTLPRMPRPLHRALLKVLVPAEAALRRLIVFAAQGLSVTLKPSSSRSNPLPPPKRGSRAGEGRVSSPPLFQLLDPQKRVARPRRRRRPEPRISIFDWDGFFVSSSELPKPKTPRKPNPDGMIDPKRLCRRLEALKRALADIPHQAKRLARWRARQEMKQPPQTTSPLREGLPPGYRKRWQHEVDDILAECHDLALLALAPDTS